MKAQMTQMLAAREAVGQLPTTKGDRRDKYLRPNAGKECTISAPPSIKAEALSSRL